MDGSFGNLTRTPDTSDAGYRRWTGADNLTKRLTNPGHNTPPPDNGRRPEDRLTKARLYQLVVVEHWGIRDAAEKVGIARQTAYQHMRDLERLHVAKRIDDTNPLGYEAGRGAASWLNARKLSAPHPIGASEASPPALSATFHRELYKWRVIDGPRRRVPWTSESHPRGVANFRLKFVFEGMEYLVWEARGKHSSTLMVWMPEYVAFQGENLPAVAQQRLELAARVLRSFAERYRYRFHGAIKKGAGPEIAIPIPGMAQPHIRSADGLRWWDDSDKTGEGHWETSSLSDGERMLEVPRWMPKVDRELIRNAERRDALERDLADHQAHLTKIDEAMLIMAHADERHDKNEEAIIAVLKANGGHSSSAPPPPDERRDVA